MTKRRPAPTNEEIARAFDRAARGQGGPLARLVKSMPRDFLARAFSRSSDLRLALHHCAGALEERDRIKAIRTGRFFIARKEEP